MQVKGNGLSTERVRSILLIQLGDIGDVVLSLPCVKTLSEAFPEARLFVAVREKAAELIEDCPWTQGVLSVNKEQRSLFKEMTYQKQFFSQVRGLNIDLAFDLRTGTRGALLSFLSGARQRVGFYADDGKVWRNRLFTHLIQPETIPGQHVSEAYLKILTAYGLYAETIIPTLAVPKEKQEMAFRLLKAESVSMERPIVAIHPFSLWKYKEWGIDKYAELINWLTSEYDVCVLVVGSLDDRREAEKLLAGCSRGATYNFAGKTSIGVLAAILNTSLLFIGGDSAGVHIAAAVGTPTVSIFGPSSVLSWAPRGILHSAVFKELPCVPCHRKGCDDGEVSRCLKELTADEVMCVVRRRLDGLLAGSREPAR